MFVCSRRRVPQGSPYPLYNIILSYTQLQWDPLFPAIYYYLDFFQNHDYFSPRLSSSATHNTFTPTNMSCSRPPIAAEQVHYYLLSSTCIYRHPLPSAKCILLRTIPIYVRPPSILHFHKVIVTRPYVHLQMT